MSPREIVVTIDVDTTKFQKSMRRVERATRWYRWRDRALWWCIGFQCAVWPILAVKWFA